jgi:hypothetical protein
MNYSIKHDFEKLIRKIFLKDIDVSKIILSDIRFEYPIFPTLNIKQNVEQECKKTHSIKYIREIMINRSNEKEGKTWLDAVYINGDFCLAIEAKFTSDISCDTTYSQHRNQLMRILDVGRRRFSDFYLLLLAPKQFRQKKSRFYCYKMEEYLSSEGEKAIMRDMFSCPMDEVKTKGPYRERIGWIDWEDLIEIIYKDFTNNEPDLQGFETFLKDRLLWPF